MGDELIHTDGRTDGQTDMTTLIVPFRSFANATKQQNDTFSIKGFITL